MNSRALATGLGIFSFGLGAAELLAPKFFAKRLGMKSASPMVRLYGLREIAAGIGILASPKIGAWMRVAGDALDLATLAPGLRAGNKHRLFVSLAGTAVSLVTAVDLLAAKIYSQEPSTTVA